jgi:plastocyanin
MVNISPGLRCALATKMPILDRVVTHRLPSRRLRHLLVATCAATLVSLPSSTGAAGRVNASVTITDSQYAPGNVTIRPGELVTWTNAGKRAHTVTSDSGSRLNSGRIRPGGEWAARFPKAETVAYHSAFLRDDMRGVVVVAGSPATAGATVAVSMPTAPHVVTLGDEISERLGSITLNRPLLVGKTAGSPGRREQILIFFAGAATATVLGGLLVRRRRYDSD